MNVLHLEDDDTDAELFEAVLRKEWPECRITRRWTRGEFETALQLENYDIILSDYTMPNFDGLAALDLARSYCPDTPFLFLSGTIGEERAIEALKHGAIDYVLKGSTARLVSAVRGALLHGQREAAKRRAEDSLKKSREQFRQIAENIDDFIVLLDFEGHCLYANPAFLRLVGRHGVPGGFSIFEDVHPEDKTRFREYVEQAMKDGHSQDLEYRLFLPGGVIRFLEVRTGFPRHRENEAVTLLLAGRDVTQRKHAEELLEEQASLLDKARDGICVINLRFEITHWNTSAERIFGRTEGEVMGFNFRDLFFAKSAAQFDTAFALTFAQGEWHGEFRLDRGNGEPLTIESSWSLVEGHQGQAKSILCINTDVTKRKLLELELQRAQRIEGLGMLAGGIAHDLNNILSPILISAALLRPLAVEQDDKMVLDTLEASASHGTELVQQILLFARGGEGQRAEVHAGQFLAELKGFLKTAIRGSVRLQIEPGDEIWPIMADATQLKQVVMNLCVNARDAMPNGGLVRIAAANVQVLPGAQRGFHGEIPPGRYVRLSVADTGTGIPPAVLEKIFDPFFTTKQIGRGTGLGLSTIAGIVKSHEGAIQVESVVGRGTTFHIYLPVAEVKMEALAEPEPEPAEYGHGECVLVVDDDEGIRVVIEKILSSHGYRALLAADGASGLKEFYRHRDEIQAVLCDHIMPGLSGSVVLEQIHREAPELPLIAMSGLVDDLIDSESDEKAFTYILAKPLTPEGLMKTVRHAVQEMAMA